jgi:hypothetical protein
MKTKAGISNLISRLAAEESQFLRASFLAPVKKQGAVAVRIAGATCRMRVKPNNFEGWGVFRPLSYTLARLEREGTLTERANYLRLFPAVQFVLTVKDGPDIWLGQPARLGDPRFSFDGLAQIDGVDDAELFDTVVARFDGSRFWFDQIDPNADPSVAAYLREAILPMVDPRLINRPDLTPEQRMAYAANHTERLRAQLANARATGEYRLRQAVEHAGAELRQFSELRDVYRVSYTVDGRRHTSVIRKNDLRVQSAGICLSGQDMKFDLASLVSILRAGQQQGEVRHGLQV